MITVSLSAALICICSWIQIPSAVPFTLQTFAVFLVANLLGAKKGVAATLIYILLGAVGLPVFSGFQGGVGALFGATGGYIFGFIPAVLIVGAAAKKYNRRPLPCTLAGVAAMAVCYLSGALGLCLVLTDGNPLAAISAGVLPFIIPDAIKIVLSALIAKRLSEAIKIGGIL